MSSLKEIEALQAERAVLIAERAEAKAKRQNALEQRDALKTKLDQLKAKEETDEGSDEQQRLRVDKGRDIHEIREMMIAAERWSQNYHEELVAIEKRIIGIEKRILLIHTDIQAAKAANSRSNEVQQTAVQQTDALIIRQLRAEFRDGLKVYGTVHLKSDKLTSFLSTHSWARRVKGWAYPCIVCGWKPEVQEAEDYPCAEARAHRVSAAHVLPSAAACSKLGFEFDETNFLPLCGAKNEVPSCHSAFDRYLLCFVNEDTEGHLWRIHASEEPYVRFNAKLVDLSNFRPHRRALHAHALHCFQTLQVVPTVTFDASVLDTTPPSGDDDPCGGDHQAVEGTHCGRRRRHRRRGGGRGNSKPGRGGGTHRSPAEGED